MLSDSVREQLSAFLDGQLGRRQRKNIMRLLKRSSEARAYLKDLQENAHCLHELPAKTLPREFPLVVMRTIAERGLQPTAAASKLPLRRVSLRVWARIAVAAAVLIGVIVGSYLMFQPAGDKGEIANVVPKKPEELPTPELPKPTPAPAPKIEAAALMGQRLELTAFKTDSARAQLTQELKKEKSFRLDMTVRNPAQAVKRIETVFKKSGIKVVVDASATASLRVKKPKMSYVLYTENVSAEEVARIMQQLGDGDKGPLQTGLLEPMSATQRLALSKELGLDPAPEPPSGELPIPLHVPPVPGDKGKGDKAKTSPPAKSTQPARFAVVLAYVPGQAGKGASSPEVQRFLHDRPPARPGTLQFVVVLRDASV